MERTDPTQFGRTAERPLPRDEEDKKIGLNVVFNITKPPEQLLDFPVEEGCERDGRVETETTADESSPNDLVPIVAPGGKCVGWRPRDDSDKQILRA